MPVTDYVKVNYGFSDIFGYKKNVQTIIEDLKDYNLWAILIVSAKLAVIFSNREFKSNTEQIKLLNSFFAKPTLERINEVLAARKEEEKDNDWVFFNEPPLLNLISLAIATCEEETGKDLASQEDLQKFGEWLLILSEQWTNSMRAPRGLQYRKHRNQWIISRYAIEGMRRSFAEQNFLNNSPHILHQFARISLITKLCSNNPYSLDIEALFKEATGHTIIEYMSFGFVMLINWSPEMGNDDLEKSVIRDMGYFTNIEVSIEKLESLLSLYSSSPSDFRYENENVVSTILKDKKYDNNFMIFMRKPIVKSTSSKFMCISQRYLIQRSTTGVYWQMNEYLNREADRVRLPKLPQAWGYGFELYINQRLSSGFGKKFIANYKNRNNDELADGLILGREALFIIEIKALHVPYSAQLKASKENLKATLKQLFGSRATKNKRIRHKRKGLQQIYHLIGLLLQQSESIDSYDLPKKIIPIIVTEEDLPVDPLNRRYYNGYAASVNLKQNSDIVNPFIILNADEIEYLEAIAEKDSSKAEALLLAYSDKQKIRNEFAMPSEVGSFKNFLDANGISLNNTNSLRREFDLMSEEIRKAFFSKQAS